MLEHKSILRQLATCTEINNSTKDLFRDRPDPHHSLRLFPSILILISRTKVDVFIARTNVGDNYGYYDSSTFSDKANDWANN